ncbi:MAG TPA: hypothetical protein DET40_25615 [Lentisphaeria bacterium]|nr:MAG: hypothetical protein A2X45_14700 [Lentisphaerae bacterium GWF2_50_93]HCE46939.1 hypothetical protein [Lentisphaeria bacterium]
MVRFNSCLSDFVPLYEKISGVNKHGTCHSFRHAYATHLLENGTDVKVIQELLGHSSIETTMIYTHVAQKKLAVVESPLDRLGSEKSSVDGRQYLPASV